MKIDGLTPAAGIPVAKASRQAAGSGFGDYLKEAMNQVEALQQDARMQAQQLMTGDAQQIHTAMIAYEKAYLAFELTLEVRNKILEAYHEVMRIQM